MDDLSDPKAVVKLLVEGMHALERDPAAGEAAMGRVCSKAIATDGKLHDRELVKRLLANPAIGRSYSGAVDTVYSANLQGVDYPEPGKAKFFVACSGADTPRPIELAKNASGQWKVVSFNSLTVGVKKAPAGDF